MAVQKDIDYQISLGDPEVVGGLSVFSEEFDEAYFYDGDDLGCIYTPELSSFCLWAPTASEVYVVLYTSRGKMKAEIPMKREDRGIWRARIKGDLLNKLYTYRVKVGTDWNEAVDPYAKAVSINGEKGAILDLRTAEPEGWAEDAKPPLESHLDAIIYEVHIRDLTIHPRSGVAYKGKYLGACETGTVGPKGIPTGFDHIRSLGVTHVQFLPMFDYSAESVDETELEDPKYNWGYDPLNYNVPEGSYATDPYNPASRILECKKMIQAYHEKGLRVVMDVVYNHLYDGYQANFMKLVPGYYFRYKEEGVFSNGSGCGNDTASERRMMRKFIVDSVLYWAREYHVDGFRFDLMGLHDVDTMNEIRQKLDELDPSILMIGEGWYLHTELAEEQKANQFNASKLQGIGHFNDTIRDAIKGSVFEAAERGFINGNARAELDVMKGIAGTIHYSPELAGFAFEPVQSVAYTEAHDNYTMWDKLALSVPEEEEGVRVLMHLLGTAIILTSQGIAFLHAGQEFLRTKDGVENSYKSPDFINWMDWERCAEYSDAVDYVRRLIALRRAHPAFRMRTAEQIRNHLFFEQAPEGCIAYTLRNHANGDRAKHLFVAHNANPYTARSRISLKGPWRIRFGVEHLPVFDRLLGGDVEIGPYGTVVLEASGDTEDHYYPV